MKLTRDNLWSLEQYSERRAEFRSEVMRHKRDRQLCLGDHVRLLFEDHITIRYQIQEMLRIEKIFEAEGIHEELDAYNPLIPDGNNWKCTLMIEYPDIEERRQQLARLVGIEYAIWLQVGELTPITAIANEDLERSTEEKTSSVHFMRFQLDAKHIEAVKAGAPMRAGVDHPNYPIDPVAIEGALREQLANDLDLLH